MALEASTVDGAEPSRHEEGLCDFSDTHVGDHVRDF